MQQYKSSKNIEIERTLARKAEKQTGEIPFELESNKSGRITTKYVKEYAAIPFITITPIIDGDHAFDVTVVVSDRTMKEFTVNIQNLSVDVVKGTILWKAK